MLLFPATQVAQSPIFFFQGDTAGDNLGNSVDIAGDVNLDGFSDLVIGAEGWNFLTGRVYVYSGRDGMLLFSVDGEGSNNSFGDSVSGAGDVNLDGYHDVAVGALWSD